MELLYVYINETENGIFKKQGVHLTDEYTVNLDFNLNKCTVSVEKNEDYYNVFKNDVISNVSALVGTNGSGKTTLLNYIYMNDVMPKHKEDRLEYQASEELYYLEHKTLQVFKIYNELIIIHNFEEKVKCEEANVIKITNETLTEMEEKNSHLYSLTKIYLTNGNYVEGSGYSSSYGAPNNINLSLNSIKTFASDFYEKSVEFSTGGIEYTLYNVLQRYIISAKTDMDFQSICDVMYFNKLFNNKKKSTFDGKVSTELHISSSLLVVILEQILKKDSAQRALKYRSLKDYSAYIKKKVDTWKNFIRKRKSDVYNFNICMKINFILELDFIYNIINEDDHVYTTIDEFYSKVKQSLELWCDNKTINYYKNAISEIDELEKIISKCNSSDNLLPQGDMAYKKNVKISYDKDKKAYLEFIDFIDKTAKKDKSFIFKYLKIKNIEMSSGERAYLNFFSWFNLLSFFHKISKNILESTRKNILLLIDEIELYCHPEWQRQFVSFLLEELSNQFVNKKIQIIFATHSPVVLSDIPLSNTVYMSKDNNENIIIERRSVHKETFASNIYNLYKDAFFFKNDKDDSIGIIGKLAYSRIKDVNRILDEIIDGKKIEETIKDLTIAKDIEELKNKENLTVKEASIKWCEYIISMIGETIIKAELERKLTTVKKQYQSKRLRSIIDSYDNLPMGEQRKLIEHIINKNNRGGI